MTWLGLKVHEFGLLILGILLFTFAGWGYGKWEFHKGESGARREQKTLTTIVEKKSNTVTTKVLTNYIPIIRTITEKGQAITKKVPVYVTVHDDARCVVNVGFGRLWNSANEMLLPSSASSVDETPSDITLSDIAAQHGRESTISNLTAEQLIALQEWVREQQSAFNKK